MAVAARAGLGAEQAGGSRVTEARLLLAALLILASLLMGAVLALSELMGPEPEGRVTGRGQR